MMVTEFFAAWGRHVIAVEGEIWKSIHGQFSFFLKLLIEQWDGIQSTGMVRQSWFSNYSFFQKEN